MFNQFNSKIKSVKKKIPNENLRNKQIIFYIFEAMLVFSSFDL